MPFGVMRPSGGVRTFHAFVKRGFCVCAIDVFDKFAIVRESFLAKATGDICDW